MGSIPHFKARKQRTALVTLLDAVRGGLVGVMDNPTGAGVDHVRTH